MVQILDVLANSVDTVLLENVMNTQCKANISGIIALDDTEGHTMTSDPCVITGSSQPSQGLTGGCQATHIDMDLASTCLLYTSDAADE